MGLSRDMYALHSHLPVNWWTSCPDLPPIPPIPFPSLKVWKFISVNMVCGFPTLSLSLYVECRCFFFFLSASLYVCLSSLLSVCLSVCISDTAAGEFCISVKCQRRFKRKIFIIFVNATDSDDDECDVRCAGLTWGELGWVQLSCGEGNHTRMCVRVGSRLSSSVCSFQFNMPFKFFSVLFLFVTQTEVYPITCSSVCIR